MTPRTLAFAVPMAVAVACLAVGVLAGSTLAYALATLLSIRAAYVAWRPFRRRVRPGRRHLSSDGYATGARRADR